MNYTIKIEPGALDDIPLVEIVALLQKHDAELVAVEGGLLIRKRPDIEDIGKGLKAAGTGMRREG